MKRIPFSKWLKEKRISSDVDLLTLNRGLRDSWYRWEQGDIPCSTSVAPIAETLGVKPIEVACAIVEIRQSELLLQSAGVFLKVMRLSRSMTFRDIGQHGISSRTWSSWENAERVPTDSHSNIKKISEILGVGESTLISVLYPARVKATKEDRRRTPLKKGRLSIRQC